MPPLRSPPDAARPETPLSVVELGALGRSAGSARQRVLETLRPDSALWRRALAAGWSFGPDAFVRYSPPFFGLAFGAALGETRRLVRNNLRRVHGTRAPLVELADVAAVFTTYASCMTEALLLSSGRGY